MPGRKSSLGGPSHFEFVSLKGLAGSGADDVEARPSLCMKARTGFNPGLGIFRGVPVPVGSRNNSDGEPGAIVKTHFPSGENS